MSGAPGGRPGADGAQVGPAPAGAASAPRGRWVMHVDMDAFYASAEVREDPLLAGRPVVVGGTGQRGVVASANYEARAYGVRSAMPCWQARKLCPQAVFLAPRFELYRELSAKFHEILNEVTPLVEAVALDEAFLDLTGALRLFGPPEEVAARARRRVAEELSLPCSVGLGPNKLVAKLASKAAKPRPSPNGAVPGPGLVVVHEHEVLGFLWPLPVEAVWGIGPASRERLCRLGVRTVGDLASLPEEVVIGALGNSAGRAAHQLAWGRDDRPVHADRQHKSVGHEETYASDVTDRAELERRLAVMADEVAGRVRQLGMAARTVTVKLRYSDMKTVTRSRSFSSPKQTGPSFVAAARALFATLGLGGGARLLGFSASGLVAEGGVVGEQLELDLFGPGRLGTGGAQPSDTAWGQVMKSVDKVRARYGHSAVGPASSHASGKGLSSLGPVGGHGYS